MNALPFAIWAFVTGTAISNIILTPSPETRRTCSRRPSPGICQAYMPRYFYNTATRRCEEFIYGGCGGNDNRFDSEQECFEKCQYMRATGCAEPENEALESGEESCSTVDIMDEMGCYKIYVNCPRLNNEVTNFPTLLVPPDCKQRYLKRPRRPEQIVTDCRNEFHDYYYD